MTYENMKLKAITGDIILLEGTGLVSKFIRVFTGQSISHVALLFWMNDGLFIAEMIEGKGYIITPASQRIPSFEGVVYYGSAPKVISDNTNCVVEKVLAYRDNKNKQAYGYLSLAKVWWAQLWHKSYEVKQKVCSTFIQEVWEHCGYKFQQTADPGDFVGNCRYIAKIDERELS